jgi:NADPH2:quinone reductase
VYHLTEADRLRAQSLLQRLLASGLLSHNIAARLPLSAVVEAHEAIESGTLVGKLVLQIQP